MFKSADASRRFWARLLDVCATGPDLLALICKQLSEQDQKALRSVCRAMRVAINSTVTRASFRLATLPTIHHKLHDAFPNVTGLAVGAFNPQSRSIEDIRDCLQWLATSDACVLSNLQQLALTIPSALTAAAGASAVWEVLSR
jgi:hypothetical protein